MAPLESPLRSDSEVFDIDDSDDDNENAMDVPNEEDELEEVEARYIISKRLYI